MLSLQTTSSKTHPKYIAQTLSIRNGLITLMHTHPEQLLPFHAHMWKARDRDGSSKTYSTEHQ